MDRMTASQYLAALPAERRRVVSAVRKVILANLPPGYRESATAGMLSYHVPLERYPETDNGEPLMYAALAARRNGYALHLMGIDAHAGPRKRPRNAFSGIDKQPTLAKACIRFRTLEDLPLRELGRLIASTPIGDFIAIYEASRKRRPAKRKSARGG